MSIESPAQKFSSCEPRYDVPPIPVPNNAALSTASWLAPMKSTAVCEPVAAATARTAPGLMSNEPVLAALTAVVTSRDPLPLLEPENPPSIRPPLMVTLAIELEPVSTHGSLCVPLVSAMSDCNPQN